MFQLTDQLVVPEKLFYSIVFWTEDEWFLHIFFFDILISLSLHGIETLSDLFFDFLDTGMLRT